LKTYYLFILVEAILNLLVLYTFSLSISEVLIIDICLKF